MTSNPGSGGVLCAGGVVVDRLLHLVAEVVPATSNPARSTSSYGGVARNVAENLGRLGVDVALVSCVGDDAAAPALLAHAAAAGVEVGGVRQVAGATTAEYVAVLDPAGDLVLGVAAMDVLGEISADDVTAAIAARRPAWVFVDCNLGAEALAAAFAAARAAGARVAVDAVSVPKAVRLGTDLAAVDVLFCNLDEAQALAAGGPAEVGAAEVADEALARAVRGRGCGAVVLTRGTRGPLVVDGSGATALPVEVVAAADVTGAGDSLVAGTLAGLLRGDDLRAAVTLGTRLAALTVASRHTVRPDLAAALAASAPASEGAPR